MHFRGSKSTDDKGTLINKKRESAKSRRKDEADSDSNSSTSSSSGSDGESTDGSAVQASYQQTLASEVEVMMF